MSSVRRITRDIADMEGHEDEGLYYFYDDANITVGYGLIIGLSDTPYHGGFYIIRFTFPDTYPNQPPLCEFLNFSSTRINPNFHDGGYGKVCLSRLNTWENRDPDSGHWIGSMDIYSVLKLIQLSVLTETPLDNEPPYNHSISYPHDSLAYNEVIRFHNYRSFVVESYLRLRDKQVELPESVRIQIFGLMTNYIKSNYADYIRNLGELSAKQDGKFHNCRIYINAYVNCDYKYVTELFHALIPKPKPVIKVKRLNMNSHEI